MPMYQIASDQLIELPTTTFAAQNLRERDDLQRLLRDQIEVIAPNVLIVSEEFGDWEDSKRRIDLLGVDRDANLVVVELKRSEDGGHMDLQALRYAAMVSKMTFDKVIEVFESYLSRRGKTDLARELLLDFLGWSTPKEDLFAKDVRIVLASAEFSKELTSTILWLNEYELDIRCVRIRPYTSGTTIFLDVQQLIPLPEASEYFVKLKEKLDVERQVRRQAREWSGLWFVNVGMSSSDISPVDANGHGNIRHWKNCVEHSYIAAGGGQKYSGALKKLAIGDNILAYQAGRGYVGYGVVVKSAVPAQDFELSGGSTLEDQINRKTRNTSCPEEASWEYVAGVEWKSKVDLEDAKTFPGAFANPNIVCRLNDPETVRFLREKFDIPEEIGHGI